jgi:uncharacterized membrane protein
MTSFLPTGSGRKLALLAVAAFFSSAGIGHFTNAEFFVAIVPPYLPAPLALVYISGVFEILGGIGVLLPRSRRLAGYGLLALLVAVYPANIHMALHPEQFADMPPAALYARLPLQFVFAAVVWWAACSPGSRTPRG